MLNHITIMGRLTRDPELRTTNSGNSVASFTLAVDRDFKNQDGERETDFISCVAWKHTADFVSQYLRKGRMAVAEGRLQVRTYTDNDGNNRKATEVIVEHVYFADSKKDDSAPAAGSYATSSSAIPSVSSTPYESTPLANNRSYQPPAQRSMYDDMTEIDDDLPF